MRTIACRISLIIAILGFFGPRTFGQTPKEPLSDRNLLALVAGNAAAVQIHDHHIRGSQHALAHTGGSDHDPLIVQPSGKIAVGGGDIAALVQHLTKQNHFAAVLTLARHSIFWGCQGKADPNLCAYGIAHACFNTMRLLWNMPI